MRTDDDTPLLPEVMAMLAAGRMYASFRPASDRARIGLDAEAGLLRECRDAMVLRLDRSAVRAAVAVADLPAPSFLRLLEPVVLPFDNLWLEWNEQDRMEAMRELPASMYDGLTTWREGNGGAARRVGYLLGRRPSVDVITDDALPATLRMLSGVMFCRGLRNQTIGAPLAWNYDPDHSATPEQVEAGIETATGIVGDAWVGREMAAGPEGVEAVKTLAARFSVQLGFGLGQKNLKTLVGAVRATAADNRVALPRPLYEIITECSAIVGGDARFVLAVLALWHMRRAVAGEAAQPARWRRRSPTRGWVNEQISYRTLAVDLPRLQADAASRASTGSNSGPAGVGGMADRSAPRRHEVAGHWCQNEAADKGERAGCQHAWVKDEARAKRGSTTMRCTGCGGTRWWRRDCERGDASLGRVVKQYRGTARRLASAKTGASTINAM